MTDIEQKPDSPENSRQVGESAVPPISTERADNEPADLVDEFADDELASFEPRGSKPDAASGA